MLHWPSDHPIEETLAAFQGLESAGKIRAWGVSNFARHGVTPHQLALSFLTRLPHLFAIPRSTDDAHVLENAAAGKIQLGEEELRILEEAFAQGTAHAGVPTI